MTSTRKTVIIIAGPTAVGKTSVAIDVARHFNTEIISADSRQCYREMSTGVARPSPAELDSVKHHFIASHSIHENISAATFERFALNKAEEIFARNHTVVMTGGTGLYIRAFAEGLDEIPEVDPAVRDKVIASYRQHGMEWLQREVREQDPAFYNAGEIQNPRRLMRALEVLNSTGRSITTFRKGQRQSRQFETVKIALNLPRESLHRNINNRVDQMIAQGLVEEAASLLPYRNLPPLHTVGYRELFKHFDGETTLEKAVEEIKNHTRQYAKRQLTWFRKDVEYSWFTPDVNAILSFLEERGHQS